MTSTELVGPIQTFRLADGTRLTMGPQNTCDPRYPLCTQHHIGCDCYEARRNENANEYRLMFRDVEDAAREVLAGHRTYPESYRVTHAYWIGDRLTREVEYDEGSCCSCTGCQIARKAHLR